jgi:hypothetical protein
MTAWVVQLRSLLLLPADAGPAVCRGRERGVFARGQPEAFGIVVENPLYCGGPRSRIHLTLGDTMTERAPLRMPPNPYGTATHN